eukprot:4785998-Pleurochrysis_carterae.AAC.2
MSRRAAALTSAVVADEREIAAESRARISASMACIGSSIRTQLAVSGDRAVAALTVSLWTYAANGSRYGSAGSLSSSELWASLGEESGKASIAGSSESTSSHR